MTLLEGHIDSIAGSDRFSMQIDDHINEKVIILDETAATKEKAMKILNEKMLELSAPFINACYKASISLDVLENSGFKNKFPFPDE